MCIRETARVSFRSWKARASDLLDCIASHGGDLPLVCALPAIFLVALAQSPALEAHDGTFETPSPWVSKSQSLIGQLFEVSRAMSTAEQEAKAIHAREGKSGDDKQGLIALIQLALEQRRIPERGDLLLWRLWLTTGMAPLQRMQNESFSAMLSRNATEFERYVKQHAHLSEEELGRLGLANAVRSLGSPLWYPTMKYLTEKIDVQFDCIISIHVFPAQLIIEQPLNSDSYARLSSALSAWLEANKERIVWDEKARRFRPRDREFVRVTELSRVLLEAATKSKN